MQSKESKTYSIDKLVLENFGPFKSATVGFDKKTYLVSGVNLKDIGQDGNGAGKSFLLDGIYFGLTGETISECKLEDLVNEDAKSGTVEIFLSGPKQIRIWRKIGSKNDGKLFINDVEVTNLVSIKDISKEVLKELGLTKFDLQNYFVISKFAYKSFFHMTDTERVNFFSRVINLEKIESTKKTLLDEVKELKKKETRLEGSVESFQAAVNSTLEKIEQMAKEDAIAAQKKLEVLLLDIKSQEDKIQLIRSEHESELLEIEQDYKLISSSDRKEREELGQAKAKSLSHWRIIRDSTEIVCPECGEIIVQDVEGNTITQERIEEAKKALGILNERISELDKSISEKRKVLEPIEKEMSDARIAYGKKFAQENTILTALKSELAQVQAQIRQINSYSISMLTDRELELASKQQELTAASKELHIVEGNLANLTKFQRVSIENILEILSGEVNKNLQKVGSELLVRIYFDKEIKIDVERNFVKKRRLSGGEKARVEIAIIFALQDLVNASSKTGLSFCAVDEIIESLEPEGLYRVAKNLSAGKKTFVLISQAILASNIPNRIIVTKNTDNFSVVTQND